MVLKGIYAREVALPDPAPNLPVDPINGNAPP